MVLPIIAPRICVSYDLCLLHKLTFFGVSLFVKKGQENCKVLFLRESELCEDSGGGPLDSLWLGWIVQLIYISFTWHSHASIIDLLACHSFCTGRSLKDAP